MKGEGVFQANLPRKSRTVQNVVKMILTTQPRALKIKKKKKSGMTKIQILMDLGVFCKLKLGL